MPTYDYQCTRCGASFELFQQMRDEPLTRCEDCGGGLRRLIGAGGGVIVRGAAGPPCRAGAVRPAACRGAEMGGCGCDPAHCPG